MTKGGARTATSLFPVGRAMGFKKIPELLKIIKKLGASDITQVQIEANKKFAWWDDPDKGGRTETCRAFMKELWRLGLIEKIILKGKNTSFNWSKVIGEASTSKTKSYDVIPLSIKTWRGKANERFKVSPLGNYILEQNENLLPYYIAWCIVEVCKKGFYPQFKNLLELSKKQGYIPVNDKEVVRLTNLYNIYVDYHGSKAIKFGYLEPSGIVYRSSKDRFMVDMKFLEKLAKTSIMDLFIDIYKKILIFNNIEFSLQEDTLGTTGYSSGSKYNFSIEIKNNSNVKKKIKINSDLFSLISNISILTYDQELIIEPKQTELIKFELESNAVTLSDSLMPTCIGFVKFMLDGKVFKLFLPQIDIVVPDHIWELELIRMFRELGVKAFHLTGKSDRPDGIIDLSGLNVEPSNLLQYLRDDSKEKLLLETTLGEYSGSKLIDDTIKKNTRYMNKFETHKNKVLKIAGIGQIIVADYFASNISQNYKRVKKEAKHIVTLIDKETLNYFIESNKIQNQIDKVITILKCGDIITKEMIDKIFNS